jgi:hypothetical protein
MEDKGYEVICLIQDHLKRIRPIDQSAELRLELGNVTNELKAFAAEKDIPVLSNTHLNREATKIVEEGLRKGNQDVGRMLGQSNMGESMLINDNTDCAIAISLDFDKDGQRYMTFNLSKMRDKMMNPRLYFAQPFVPGSTIRLIEDVNGTPQFKESVHALPELNNNKTIIKMSGSTSIMGDLDNILTADDDNTFSNNDVYIFDDDENDKPKAIKPIIFFDEEDHTFDDILKDLEEIE